jgi:hypothetical protein
VEQEAETMTGEIRDVVRQKGDAAGSRAGKMNDFYCMLRDYHDCN